MVRYNMWSGHILLVLKGFNLMHQVHSEEKNIKFAELVSVISTWFLNFVRL